VLIVPECLNAPPPAVLPQLVRQHATLKCARTPITNVTTRLQRYRTGLHLAIEPQSMLLEPSLPALAATFRAICRPLKAHR